MLDIYTFGNSENVVRQMLMVENAYLQGYHDTEKATAVSTRRLHSE